MLNDVIKGVLVDNPLFCMDRDGNQHLLYSTGNGVQIHIAPHLGIARKVFQFPTTNSYLQVTYSHISNHFYFRADGSRELVRYNWKSGQVKSFTFKEGIPFFLFGGPTRYSFAGYDTNRSIDGHIYLGCYSLNNIDGYVRFNVETEEFDDYSLFPDREYTHLHGRGELPALKIDTGSFAGVYSQYLFSPDLEDLWATIESEITASGLTWSKTYYPYLHTADRAIGSATRRIMAVINGTTKFIDIKSPSTYLSGTTYATNDWVDHLGNSVSKTGWSSILKLKDFSADTGLVVPFAMGYSYNIPVRVGRYVYSGNSYMANKDYFFTFAVHPTTKEAIYPVTFDKTVGFYDNRGFKDVWINFNGDFGFSTSHEPVRFITNGTVYGFIRPDTHVWQAYDIDSNPSGYNRTVYNSGFPISFFGNSFIELYPAALVEYTLGDSGALKHSNSMFTCAVGDAVGQELSGEIATLSITVYADKDKAQSAKVYEVPKCRTSILDMTSAVEVAEDKIIAGGITYSGLKAINVIDEDSYTVQATISANTLSPNGLDIVATNKVVMYGYLGALRLVDTSDWNNIQSSWIPAGDGTETMYVSGRENGFLITGSPVRQAAYFEGLRLSFHNFTNGVTSVLTSVLPDVANVSKAITFRATTLNLPDNSYSDANVETAVQTYMTASGKTRAQVIAEAIAGCVYVRGGIESWGNKTVIGLDYRGLSALKNIRIETTPGSGTWVDTNYWNGLLTAKFLYINTSSILSAVTNDFKVISIYGTSELAYNRITQTDNYILLVKGGQFGTISIIPKTSIDAAATSTLEVNIESFITYDFGVGGGYGDVAAFNSTITKQLNCFAHKDDFLYVTCYSNTNLGGGIYAAILKVNAVDSSYEIFATSTTSSVRTISIRGARMLIISGKDIIIVDNFESATLPITI